jgi:hypothetical protein
MLVDIFLLDGLDYWDAVAFDSKYLYIMMSITDGQADSDCGRLRLYRARQ